MVKCNETECVCGFRSLNTRLRTVIDQTPLTTACEDVRPIVFLFPQAIMSTFSAVRKLTIRVLYCNIAHCSRHITKLMLSFCQILEFRFREKSVWKIPPRKVAKESYFCQHASPATVPMCFEANTTKLTFSTKSVEMRLSVGPTIARETRLPFPTTTRVSFTP